MDSLKDYQLFKFISEDFRELRIIRRIKVVTGIINTYK